MFNLFVVLSVLLSTSFAAPDDRGGHTGNGGGIVECPGKAPIVLDYYEALRSGEKLLDVEKMSREEFFQLMVERLFLGEQYSRELIGGVIVLRGGWQSSSIGSLGKFVKVSVKEKKGIDEWPEIPEWKVKDEFVEGNLPDHCHFEQAAISVLSKDSPFRIRTVTDRLSDGQKMILELHEFLNQANYAGTSMNTRQLVATLLRSKINYKIMRIAVSRFVDPSRDYYWKRFVLEAADISDPIKGYPFSRGLYALDLRGMSKDQKAALSSCPKWVGIVPSDLGNHIMQLFQDSTDESEDLILPMKRVDLLQKSIVGEYEVKERYRRGVLNRKTQEVQWDLEILYSEALRFKRNNGPECGYISVASNINLFCKEYENAQQMKRTMENDLFPRMALHNWGFAISTYVKRVRNYYEEKRLGIENQYENQFQKIRELLNW